MAKRILNETGLQSADVGAGEINAMNMVNSDRNWGRRLGIVAWAISGMIPFGIVSLHVFEGNRALAQVTPDATLGAETSVVTPNVDINGIGSDRIDGGAIRGANLFHSFSDFNVIDAQRAIYFTNPAGIENIFSRVTGTNPSNIQGTLGVLGNANLFLLNPNGILFGPNARLDLQGGSFVGTTASGVRFRTGGEFSMNSAVTPGDSLLTVNPSALIFNQIPGPITNQSIAPNSTDPNLKDGLRVPDGENLFLVGGDVRLENGGTVRALGGRIELGGLAGTGEVKIEELTTGTNPQLNFPDVKLTFLDGVTRANVSLTNGAIADVVAGNGGDVAIRARNIDISQASNICAGIGSTPTCGGTTASPTSSFSRVTGNILLDATGNVSISQSSRVENNINEGATGFAANIFDAIENEVLFGSIVIRANSFSLTGGSQLSTSTFGEGSAGVVAVDANGDVLVDNSQIFSNSYNNGDAGGILVEAGSISLNNALLDSRITGEGDGGVISLEAKDGSVALNNSIIRSDIADGAKGDARGIQIEASSISLSNGSELQAQTAGDGNAGDVIVKTNGGSVSLDNSKIFASVEPGGEGKGGNIRIETGSLTMSNGSGLQTLLRGPSDDGTLPGAKGDAGVIVVLAEDSVSLSESGMFSRINAGADGDTGNNQFAGNVFGELLGTGGDIVGSIFISTGTLSLTDNSELDSSTFGKGNAGAVVVLATDKVSLSNASNIFSRVESGGVGNSGGIVMGVGELSVTGNSKITTSALGVGNPGIILVEADKDISLRGNGSGIFSQVSEDNPKTDLVGGGIGLQARSLFIRDGAAVSVSNFGPDKAGDIEVTAREDIILRDEGIIAAISASGKGGNIYLTSGDSLILVSGSQVSTEAGRGIGFGNGGNVDVDTRYIIAAPFNDNNISAEAFAGDGGRINFQANRLYDIAERINVLVSNDIDASSDFGLNGIVTSDVLNTDPTQGLTNLPTNPIDPSTLIAENCAPRGGIADRPNNQFIVTKTGGLPPDPNAAFTGEAVVNDLETNTVEEENNTQDPNSTNPTSPVPAATASPQQPEIVEAQGWVYGENGDVIFTAQAPTVTPTNPALTPASTCNGF